MARVAVAATARFPERRLAATWRTGAAPETAGGSWVLVLARTDDDSADFVRSRALAAGLVGTPKEGRPVRTCRGARRPGRERERGLRCG